MRRMNVTFWYNTAMALLLAAIAADFVFGLDAVLNGLSTMVVVALTLAVLGLIGAGAFALCWIVVRDVIDDIAFDRRHGIAWRWRLFGYAGLLGIFIDGIVGAWNAYQQHILFSTAVEQIPLAGVPVLLALASYPVKWIEQYYMRKHRLRDGASFYGSAQSRT